MDEITFITAFMNTLKTTINNSNKMIQLFDILWNYNKCTTNTNTMNVSINNSELQISLDAEIWKPEMDLDVLKINDNNVDGYIKELACGIKILLNYFNNIDKTTRIELTHLTKLHFDLTNVDSYLFYFARSDNTFVYKKVHELTKKMHDEICINIFHNLHDTIQKKNDQITLPDHELMTYMNSLINIHISFICVINGYLNKQISVDMMEHCMRKFEMSRELMKKQL